MLVLPWRGFAPCCGALGGGGEHAAAAEDGGGGGHGGGAGGEEAVGDAVEGAGAEVAGAAEVDAVEGAGGAEGGEAAGDVGAEGGAVDDGGVVPKAAAADPDAGVVAVAEVAAAAAADGGEGDAAAVVPGATAVGGAAEVVEEAVGSVEQAVVAEGGVDGAEVGAGPADGGGGAGDGDLGAVVGGELLLLEELLAGLEFEGALDDAESEFGGLAFLGDGLFAGFGEALLLDEFFHGGLFLVFLGALGVVAEFVFPGVREVGEEDFGGAFGVEEGDAVGVDLADPTLAVGATGEGGELGDLIRHGRLGETAEGEEQGQDQGGVFHGGAELNFHTL